MIKLIILYCFVSIALGSFLPDLDGRIVGGNETTIENYPYQVSITYNLRHICGGSIIDETTILTAAHCTHKKNHHGFNVRVGTTHSNNYNDKGQILFISKIIEHENFNIDTVDNDITIIKVTAPIKFSPKVQPIPLIKSGADVPDNTEVIVTGWGNTSPLYSVDVLREVKLQVVNRNKCKEAYGEKLTEHMFCAQAPGKDACQGDSGGPVAANGELAGIVSWGIGCARPNYPGIFTRLSVLRPWIDQHM